MKYIGTSYNNWLIIDKDRYNKSTRYICQCIVCHTQTHIYSRDLSRAKCSFCNKKIGAKYGKWTVLDKIKQPDKTTAYLCVCECGNLREVPSNQLITRRSSQCKQCANKKLGLAAHKMLTEVWSVYRDNTNRTIKEIFREKYNEA